MVVEAASSENTLFVSFGHDICPSVLALSNAHQPLLSYNVGKIHIYLILKIKNANWKIKRDKFWKIKMKH